MICRLIGAAALVLAVAGGAWGQPAVPGGFAPGAPISGPGSIIGSGTVGDVTCVGPGSSQVQDCSAFSSVTLPSVLVLPGPTLLNGAAAATLELGIDAASPIAQTLKASDVATGTMDTAGATFTIQASASTGTGTGGDIIFQTAGAGTSGTSKNAYSNRFIVKGTGETLIGTTARHAMSNGSPIPGLQVTNNSQTVGANAAAILSYRNASNIPATLYLGFSKSNTSGTQAATASGDRIGSIMADGSDGTNFQDSSQILFKAGGTVGSGNVPGEIDFLTVAAGGAATLVQAGAFTDAQSFVLNNAALATNATDGFIYIASGAGTPTGTPTTFTGRVPMYLDTTNSQLWLYMGGGWKQPKTPAGAATVTWQ